MTTTSPAEPPESTLAADERRDLGCSCTRLDDEWHHVRFCPVPTVERIVAARIAQLEADLAAAEAKLAAAKRLVDTYFAPDFGGYDWRGGDETVQQFLRRLTAALATQPAP